MGAPGEEESDKEEPGEEAEVLGRGEVVVGVEEVCAVEDGVVEDERLGEERGVGGPLVLGVVEVGDAGGDLADLPAAEAGVEEAVAVLLLHPPELGVGAEGLGERVGLLAAEEGEVAHPGEAAVRLVQQRPELLGRPPAAAGAALGALALLLRRRRHGDPLPFLSPLSRRRLGRVVATPGISPVLSSPATTSVLVPSAFEPRPKTCMRRAGQAEQANTFPFYYDNSIRGVRPNRLFFLLRSTDHSIRPSTHLCSPARKKKREICKHTT